MVNNINLLITILFELETILRDSGEFNENAGDGRCKRRQQVREGKEDDELKICQKLQNRN